MKVFVVFWASGVAALISLFSWGLLCAAGMPFASCTSPHPPLLILGWMATSFAGAMACMVIVTVSDMFGRGR